MATFRGVEGACHALVELLRDNYVPGDFPNHNLEFKVLAVAELGSEGPTAGVTVALYRITLNEADRTPPGRRTDDGGRFRSQLPLDLHVLLTVWGQDASLQQAIAGWMMRVMEDHPVLPAGLLNRRTDGVFRPDEAAEVSVGQLATEDLLQLWDIVQNGFQLSVPYQVRNVRIESEREVVSGAPVQDRIQRYEEVVR